MNRMITKDSTDYVEKKKESPRVFTNGGKYLLVLQTGRRLAFRHCVHEVKQRKDSWTIDHTRT